jgi:N-acetylglucosaminyldiphosphoundecaprenol N-acetyl-beta-D-mannosaminyltransferase
MHSETLLVYLRVQVLLWGIHIPRIRVVREVPSYQLLGLRLNAITELELYEVMSEVVEAGRKCVIAHHNLHSVYLYHHDAKMRRFYERAHYVYADGVPLIYLGKLLGHPLRLEHRSTCAEYVYAFMAQAARRGWRVFYLGSRPGVPERGAEILREKETGLQIAVAHGYFSADTEENQRVLETLNAFQPNVLMVGMGMPRQEHWILDNLENIQANVVISVGGCINYVAGTTPTPPRWMAPVLFQGIYRLLNDPRRLWRRYLLESWFVLGLALRECAKRSRTRG